MADRVAIIGGSTVGRDHFPFPVPDLTGGSSYIIALSLADIATAFFKVRKWRVHGSLTSASGTANFDWIATIGDDVSADVGSQASTITTESKLVLSPFLDSGDDIDGVDGSLYEIGMFTFFADVAARYSSGSFYPAFFARVYSGTAIGTVLDTRPTFVSSPVASSVVAKVIINGHDYVFTMYVGSAFIGGVSGTFTIEPSEYWPYATKAGLPVYNTSTGAQLRDPFS